MRPSTFPAMVCGRIALIKALKSTASLGHSKKSIARYPPFNLSAQQTERKQRMNNNEATKEQTDEELLAEMYSDQQTQDALDRQHEEDMQAMFRDEEWVEQEQFMARWWTA